MTAFAPLLSVRVTHDYYRPEPVPAQILLRPTREQVADGVTARDQGRAYVIFAPRDNEDASETTTLALDLLRVDPEFLSVTGPISQQPVQVTLSENAEVEIDLGASVPTAPSIVSADGVVARLLVTVPFAAPAGATLTIGFPTIASHWTYHIVGGDPDVALSIMDQASSAEFEPITPPDLPGSRVVRSFRSATALPLSRRPRTRFDLVREGPFGPQTLISPLPAAAASTSPFNGSGADPRLQSEIFVTL